MLLPLIFFGDEVLLPNTQDRVRLQSMAYRLIHIIGETKTYTWHTLDEIDVLQEKLYEFAEDANWLQMSLGSGRPGDGLNIEKMHKLMALANTVRQLGSTSPNDTAIFESQVKTAKTVAKHVHSVHPSFIKFIDAIFSTRGVISSKYLTVKIYSLNWDRIHQ